MNIDVNSDEFWAEEGDSELLTAAEEEWLAAKADTCPVSSPWARILPQARKRFD